MAEGTLACELARAVPAKQPEPGQAVQHEQVGAAAQVARALRALVHSQEDAPLAHLQQDGLLAL